MRNRSTAATIVRALLALVALVALVAGVPAVLLGIGVLPDHVPGVGEITTALTSPDTGQLFLGAVTLIGWYGWISFVISVVLETGAALRHVRAPRIRMLGGSQQLAGALVGGILILLPAGTAMATPATAAPAASATAATASVSAGTQTETPAPASSTYRGPVHQVQDGDTLWDIAEKRLGAGIEWHRIVDANDGVRQADGSLVTADTTALQPGWILRLPADASPAPSADQGGARTQTAGSKAASETHTVRAGETLTGIAEDELGDADAYPRIVEANKGVEQDDGRALDDPDEIYPGWELKIPAAAGSDPSDSKPDQAQPPREQPADQGKAEELPGAEQTQPPAQEKPGPGADQGEKGETAQTPGQGSDQDIQDGGQPSEQPPAQDPAPDREREQHGTPTQAPEAHDAAGAADSGDQSVQTIAAAGSILAAAVLAVVAARRARQQRRRRPKRRIPMPSGATADFEKQLRVASDITGAALADRALRTLAANCRQAGRPLPEVEAMRITARGIELHLAAVTPTVAPFTEHENKPTVWVCPARGAALLDEDEAADITVPYPALVSLGETEDGDTVLVNLEAIGLLRLGGSPADVRAVMLALAVELASSRLAPDTQVVLAGAGSDLHHLYPDQIEHHADLGPATTGLQAHDAFQRQALVDGGHDHLRAARLGEDGGDTWIPRILIATAPPTGPAAAELEDLLASRPRTSVAVVTAAGGELDLPGAWILPAQPGTLVELPDLDLAVKLQHLDADSYDRLVQLIATSSRTDDVPPPAWTGHTGPADTNGPRSTVPVGEDSALAPETSAAPAVTTAVATQGSGLATALPAFTAFSPALTPDEGPADSGSGDGWEEEQEGSALSPAVAGYPAFDKQPDEDTDSNSAGEPTGWEVPEPAEDDGDSEEASALGAEVWNTTEQDFETVLGEVLGERDDDSPVPPDDEEASSGLSAAALGDSPDEEGSPEDDSALADEEDDAESGLTAAALAVTAPAVTTAEARIIPRPSAATSTVLAALATPPAEPEGPQVQVLGPVTLTGAQGRVGSNRHNHLLEIAAWLVLHPGLGRQDLDNAIWPGLRKTSSTRNTAISRLRSWLGPNPHLPADDPQGAYLPAVTEGIYRLGPAVTSDWDRFKELYQQGMHHDGQDADVALAHALALVRGRPFADVDPSKYCWAEADIQEMISAIVDVAHELAERRRQVRDYRAAAQAVTKGMLVDSQSELLYRDLFTICHEMGDREGLERAAAQLARINMEEGVDSSPETVGLLRTLLKGERIKPTLGSAAS
ncbi:LysM peptidoglycan-binding domain-containing protein (plasmid) [Streptomyces sp. AM 4-1-1]|uniref:LysM peptidoglycan-binding domain-containing protein n=1 Tax=Streptomyces sp. AM 4-1-1 TaxID=3028710 RepID=UPI0023B9B67E|nr:LysM peptidoglycan-binding domain-containing protein [Streptomyces sp. AM 4-1-1]WEH37904.1 LysM peptidoglycan-binding domain-containing protein [Streptomyces sp. AM 4-1-1]